MEGSNRSKASPKLPPTDMEKAHDRIKRTYGIQQVQHQEKIEDFRIS
jgi:hypothetical protein